MPGPHQITAAVLPGPDQIPGGFLLHTGHRDRGQVVHPQQPGQQQRIPAVGLHPIPRRPADLRRCRDLAPEPGRGQVPGQPEPGRTGLIGHRHRTRQTRSAKRESSLLPGRSCRSHTSPVTVSRPAAATDRACTSRPTLVRSVNTGASQPRMSDRPDRNVWQPTQSARQRPRPATTTTRGGQCIPKGRRQGVLHRSQDGEFHARSSTSHQKHRYVQWMSVELPHITRQTRTPIR